MLALSQTVKAQKSMLSHNCPHQDDHTLIPHFETPHIPSCWLYSMKYPMKNPRDSWWTSPIFAPTRLPSPVAPPLGLLGRGVATFNTGAMASAGFSRAGFVPG